MVRRTILRYRLILLGIATAIMMPILMTVAHPNNTTPEVPVLGAYEETEEAEETMPEIAEEKTEEAAETKEEPASETQTAGATATTTTAARKTETRTITVTENGYAADNEDAPETAAIAPVDVETEENTEEPADAEDAGEEIGE